MRAGRRRILVAALAATLLGGPVFAEPQTESVAQTICRLIEGAAKQHELPVAFFTRLIWRESSFRPHVTSPAGAQGIAQFMPGTANERGLADPAAETLVVPDEGLERPDPLMISDQPTVLVIGDRPSGGVGGGGERRDRDRAGSPVH